MSERVALAFYAAAFVVGLSIAWPATTVAWDDYKMTGFPDGVAEKYLAMAAWDGTGADVTLSELADHYGLPDSPVDSPVTRTPGNAILVAPLLAVPDRAVVPLLGVLSLISALAVCLAASRISGFPYWLTGLAALLVVWSHPMLSAYITGTTAVVVAALVAGAWVWRERPVLAGVMLAAAASMKVWPVVLVVPLWFAHRKAAKVALGVGAGLAGLGMLLPGASLAQAGGYEHWIDLPWNWSLVPDLGLGLALAVGAGIMAAAWMLWPDFDRRASAFVVAGLAATPLVWSWYWIAAIPAAFVAARSVVCGRVEVGRPVEADEVIRPIEGISA